MRKKTDSNEGLATRTAWPLTGQQFDLYAEEVAPAITFHAALGFEESYRCPTTSTSEHGEVRSGGFTLGVSSTDAARVHHGLEASQDGRSVEIVLCCNDSHTAYSQALAAEVTILRGPHDFQNGWLHIARVFDPVGKPLVLVQKRDTDSWSSSYMDAPAPNFRRSSRDERLRQRNRHNRWRRHRP